MFTLSGAKSLGLLSEDPPDPPCDNQFWQRQDRTGLTATKLKKLELNYLSILLFFGMGVLISISVSSSRLLYLILC